MKVDDMPAGRELDALVAEKVMGWIVGVCEYKDKNDKHMGWVEDSDDPDDWSTAWSPSTDIAAAWEVVEKMRAGGYAFDSYSSAEIEAEHPWSDAIFIQYDGEDRLIEESDRQKTMPLAIVKAALKAVGV